MQYNQDRYHCCNQGSRNLQRTKLAVFCSHCRTISYPYSINTKQYIHAVLLLVWHFGSTLHPPPPAVKAGAVWCCRCPQQSYHFFGTLSVRCVPKELWNIIPRRAVSDPYHTSTQRCRVPCKCRPSVCRRDGVLKIHGSCEQNRVEYEPSVVSYIFGRSMHVCLGQAMVAWRRQSRISTSSMTEWIPNFSGSFEQGPHETKRKGIQATQPRTYNKQTTRCS